MLCDSQVPQPTPEVSRGTWLGIWLPPASLVNGKTVAKNPPESNEFENTWWCHEIYVIVQVWKSLTRSKKDGNKLKDAYRVFMGPVCLFCIVWLGWRRSWGRPRTRRHRSHGSRRVTKLTPAPKLGVRPPVVRPDQVVEVEVPCRGGQVGRHHLLLFGSTLVPACVFPSQLL